MLYCIFTIAFTVYEKTGRKLRTIFGKRCLAVTTNDVNKPVADMLFYPGVTGKLAPFRELVFLRDMKYHEAISTG